MLNSNLSTSSAEWRIVSDQRVIATATDATAINLLVIVSFLRQGNKLLMRHSGNSVSMRHMAKMLGGTI
jgi:hypothetical protein